MMDRSMGNDCTQAQRMSVTGVGVAEAVDGGSGTASVMARNDM